MAGRAVDNGHIEDPGASTVVQVAVGEAHTLALTANGSVYTWGRGQFGRMGMGVSQDELVPTLVEILPMGVEDEDPDSPTWDPAERSRITQLAAGSYHSLALSGDGTVWSWGFNACQLGREGAASYPAPISFVRPGSSFSFDDSRKSYDQDSQNTDSTTKVVVVEAGGMMSSAIDKDGGLWLWGAVPEPSAGVQITDSDLYHKSDAFELANIDKPGRVLALRDQRVRRVVCGNEHILALVEERRNGGGGVECYAWGSNSYGQLGLGDFEARDMPTLVTAVSAAPRMGTAIVDFACGAFHSVVVTTKDGGETETEVEITSSMARRGGDAHARAAAQLMDHVMASPKLRGRATPTPELHYVESSSLGSPRARSRQPGGLTYPCINRNQSGYGSDGSSARAYSQSSMTSWAGNNGRAHGEFNPSDGRVSTCWTFGQGENGQLGHGTRANSHTPAAVEALPTRERIQTAVCGLFHTAVVTESGDVWVWGMEGGLGQCPGIGPPGSKTGDALTPVRVFGESSARCAPVTGAKGIACGAAHTVTVSNGGTDLWAWGRGKNGVLGLGHHSDSWFPSPVMWPPGTSQFTSKSDHADAADHAIMYPKASSRASSSRGGRGDEMREESKPPRSSSYGRVPREELYGYPGNLNMVNSSVTHRKGLESPGRPTSRRAQAGDLQGSPGRASRGMQSPGRPSRRGDHYWPPATPEPDSFRREDAMLQTSSEDVSSLKAELVECRRYAESLHTAVYGGVEAFALELPRNAYNNYNEPRFNGRKPITHGNGSAAALQNWHQHMEEASLEELAKLEIFYKGMRNRLKDVLFQRRMEDWCRRTMSGISSSASTPVQSAPYFDGPGELALRMSGIISDRGEMLPPDALAASLAELRMHFQRSR